MFDKQTGLICPPFSDDRQTFKWSLNTANCQENVWLFIKQPETDTNKRAVWMTQFFVFFYAVLTSKPLEREMACQNGELKSIRLGWYWISRLSNGDNIELFWFLITAAVDFAFLGDFLRLWMILKVFDRSTQRLHYRTLRLVVWVGGRSFDDRLTIVWQSRHTIPYHLQWRFSTVRNAVNDFGDPRSQW